MNNKHFGISKSMQQWKKVHSPQHKRASEEEKPQKQNKLIENAADVNAENANQDTNEITNPIEEEQSCSEDSTSDLNGTTSPPVETKEQEYLSCGKLFDNIQPLHLHGFDHITKENLDNVNRSHEMKHELLKEEKYLSQATAAMANFYSSMADNIKLREKKRTTVQKPPEEETKQQPKKTKRARKQTWDEGNPLRGSVSNSNSIELPDPLGHFTCNFCFKQFHSFDEFQYHVFEHTRSMEITHKMEGVNERIIDLSGKVTFNGVSESVLSAILEEQQKESLGSQSSNNIPSTSQQPRNVLIKASNSQSKKIQLPEELQTVSSYFSAAAASVFREEQGKNIHSTPDDKNGNADCPSSGNMPDAQKAADGNQAKSNPKISGNAIRVKIKLRFFNILLKHILHCMKKFNYDDIYIPKVKQINQNSPKTDFPFRCKFCNQNYSDFDHLLECYSAHADQLPRICDQCGEKYPNDAFIAGHLELHPNVFNCDNCKKTFGESCELHEHLHKCGHFD